MERNYDPRAIEPKWQKYWEEHQTFRTDAWDFSRPKFYALDMFPYPSGVGLHAGHPEGFTRKNIETFSKQLKELGFDYDWSKVIATSDPEC